VRKALEVEGKKIVLQSWDTAGQDRFRAITSSYYKSAMGAIICYDCTDEQTLFNVKQWIHDFRERARQGAPILLVATKDDLTKVSVSSEGKTSQSGSSGEAAESRRNGGASTSGHLILPAQQGENQNC